MDRAFLRADEADRRYQPAACAGGGRGIGQPLSFLRATRARELVLLWHLAASVIFEWQARLDPIGTLALELDLGGGALSLRERSALLEAVAEEFANPQPMESPAMLEAAGRWYWPVALPEDEDELMGRMPLRLRIDVGA